MKSFWERIKRKPRDRLLPASVDKDTRSSLTPSKRQATIELEFYRSKRRRSSLGLALAGLATATIITLSLFGVPTYHTNGTTSEVDPVLADSCQAAYYAVHNTNPKYTVKKYTHQISITAGDLLKFTVTTDDSTDEITHIRDVIFGPDPRVIELGLEDVYLRDLRLKSQAIDARIEGIEVSTNHDLAKMMLKHLTGALYNSDSRAPEANKRPIRNKHFFRRKAYVEIQHNNQLDESGNLLVDICLPLVLSKELTGEKNEEKYTTISSALVGENVARLKDKVWWRDNKLW